MGAVKQTVSDLVRMLNRRQKEATKLPIILDRLESYLREEPRKIIHLSLFLLLTRIEEEAAKIIGGKITRWSVVMLVSPDLRVSVEETYDVSADSWLERLKSQGFSILTLEQFRSFIRSLQLEVTQGNYMPAIEVLRANAEFQRASPYPPSVRKAEAPREPSPSSRWKPSDFLPALPPHPPLPRGLFKD